MKLHRNLVAAVIDGLRDILIDNQQADLTVANLLVSNKSWGARDRNFIAENIYHIVRYKRLYEFCIEDELFGDVSLRQMVGAKLFLENGSLPPWEEFTSLNTERIAQRAIEARKVRKIRESIPDWLDAYGMQELGPQWDQEITALNQAAQFSIRVNTLKTNKAILSKLLTDEGLSLLETDVAPDALIILSRKNFKTHPAYKNGLFEVQDVSSQMVSQMLDVAPGMNVIDGCSGAGGKTLHLAALMQNKGEILAVDVHEKKLEELERRAKRAGCHIVKAMHTTRLTKFHQALMHSFADRILIDVPCSGSGVFRRKPDAKWTLTKTFVEELQLTQSQILDEYAPMLKKDGLMVYSTCSIFPGENEKQIEKFLTRHAGYKLLEEKKISPADTGFDGFYMAKMQRII